jgi:CheY-like chemotaxis protein
VTERSAKQAGYVCETASNGAIALERLQQALPGGEIDIVLIDFQMPIMDGPTCVTRYRAFETDLLRKLEVQGLERQLQRALERSVWEDEEDEEGEGEGQEQGQGQEDGAHHREQSAADPGQEGEAFPLRLPLSPSLSSPHLSLVTTTSPRAPRRVPIIGMSANSDDENRRLGLAAGMDQFISKPFSMKDLQPLIEQVFRDNQ